MAHCMFLSAARCEVAGRNFGPNPGHMHHEINSKTKQTQAFLVTSQSSTFIIAKHTMSLQPD